MAFGVPGFGVSVSPAAAAKPNSPAPAVTAERRIALIIGNSNYRVGPLKNPGNDARAVADALRQIGFEVTVRENLGMRALVEAMRDFSVRAPRYDVRLFYYAGHGIQTNGRNYLLPVDADLRGEDEIPFRSADVTELVERLGQLPNGNNIVVLDACRNNPFRDLAVAGPDGRTVRVKFRGATPSGLAEIAAPAGMVVAFSTRPGQVALDGIGIDNSLYAKHFLAHVRTPGLTIDHFFRRVRAGVFHETKGMQRPFEEGSLFTDFCFRPAPDGSCGEAPLADPSSRLGSGGAAHKSR
jgi:uncharacterized caspase-like protein